MARSKTNSELREELRCIEVTKVERKISDDKYAIKLVEKIVFGIIWVIILAVIGALISLVIKN